MAVNHTPILLYGEDQSLQSIKKKKKFIYLFNNFQLGEMPHFLIRHMRSKNWRNTPLPKNTRIYLEN